MRTVYLFFAILALSICSLAQGNLQKLVDTENAFAQAAADKGTKSAFLEFLADDGIVFNPQRANGKQVWTARKESASMLSWYPMFADISSNGLIGYTTGPWEFRQKGKDDAPVAFGHYMTIWQRQLDGNYKAALDLGISHDKPASPETKFTPTIVTTGSGGKVTSYAGDTAASFFGLLAESGAEKAYRQFAADDIRLMRDGKAPILGKKAAIKEISSNKNIISTSKRTAFFGSEDISYTTNTYKISKDGQVIETGNFVQIWKYRGGKWQIVLDEFVADPKK
ncbi:MAG: nuclear transport factor 2 family protein [Acidobacteriota bacterium]